MASKDNCTLLKRVPGFASASISATKTGDTIDLQNYESCTFVLSLGTGALDGSNYWTVKLQHGDASDMSDAADVTAGDLIGAMGSDGDNKLDSSANDSSKCHKLGYKGPKRYVRIVLTLTGTMTQVMGCIVDLGHARDVPA